MVLNVSVSRWTTAARTKRATFPSLLAVHGRRAPGRGGCGVCARACAAALRGGGVVLVCLRGFRGQAESVGAHAVWGGDVGAGCSRAVRAGTGDPCCWVWGLRRFLLAGAIQCRGMLARVFFCGAVLLKWCVGWPRSGTRLVAGRQQVDGVPDGRAAGARV